MRSFLFTLVLWVIQLMSYCQENGYTQYDNKNGLAGSTVYCMTQDKDGFLWFGTEVGLSRFDGTHFRNFTRLDGLPDNEIIQLFADSKGRVWISPFKKAVCYYYKGKMHTRKNDPLLKRIQLNDNVVHFAEDKAGNILMQETSRLHLIDVNNHVTVVDRINGRPINFINAICTAENGFMVVDGNCLYDYDYNVFRLRKKIPSLYSNHFDYFASSSQCLVWRDGYSSFRLECFDRPKPVTIPLKASHINFCFIDKDHIADCTREGVVVYNINNGESSKPYLPGLAVSSMFRDKEGNTWFTTLGHGIYKLSSPFVLNVRLRQDNIPAQVFSFAPYKGSIIASTELNCIFSLNPKTGMLGKEKIILEEKGINPVLILNVYKGKYILCGTNVSVYKMDTNYKWIQQVNHIVVKGLFLHNNKLFVATKNNVMVVDPATFRITDTIWHERSTTVYVSNDTAYIGTLGGLYCFLPDRTTKFLGEKIPALSARITAVQKDAAGVLWVATYGDGLIGYKNDRVIAVINSDNGLTSNICRNVYLCGNYLWVGTEKGINKINVMQPEHPITKYTTGDGLASDVINALYVDSNKVFVGTPEGVTFFDEEKMSSQSRCDLLFTDILVGGKTYYPGEAPVQIPHAQNNLQFNYVGISYKSTGDVRYRYRLLGLDSTWHETRETSLTYPTLPSGEYTLQLQAINKFDVTSQLLIHAFSIEKLLYERTWFQVLIGLLFLAITGVTVGLIIRRIRRREQEKTAFIKRINDLEQLSRKAQMNPHFIFNSLNSIQQYVMDTDVSGANKFISGFSRLIRQTLDFSSKPEITLEEELDYLTNYLEIEKTRLEDAFKWEVHVDKAVDPAEYYIPPMILQPFVENSVRHGLRFRRDKNGVVTITVKRVADHLVCILEDNGVGRKAAMQYKSISPINYQSKGLSLTADRITLFNQEHEQKITMQIEDLEDELHQALGTRVTIKFPVLS